MVKSISRSSGGVRRSSGAAKVDDEVVVGSADEDTIGVVG